jgi:hypothetical protein
MNGIQFLRVLSRALDLIGMLFANSGFSQIEVAVLSAEAQANATLCLASSLKQPKA